MLIDTHCHLDFPELAADRAGVLARAKAAGVGQMITISTQVAKADVYRAVAEENANVFFTVGTHPHEAHKEPEASVETIVALAAHPKCVGIGEAGLDYHYDRAPRATAQRVFRTHIAAARQTGLPLVIHARDADDDTGEILEDEMGKGPFTALLHCFTASQRLADRALALGLYISFSGVVTFKNSEEIRAVARATPRERILVETDAPFLAPIPYRGKRNEPAYVAATAASLAETLGMSAADLAAQTTTNARRLFTKLPPL